MTQIPHHSEVAHPGRAADLSAAPPRAAAAPRLAAALHQRHLAPGAARGGTAGHGAVVGMPVFLWSLGKLMGKPQENGG